MSAFSKLIADAIGNHFLRNTAYTSPVTVYLALHADGVTNPGDPGTAPGNLAAAAFASEGGWTGYQRQAITFSAPTGDETATFENNNTVAFPEVDEGEGPVVVTGMSIWTEERGGDLGSSGDYLFHGPVITAKELEETDASLVPVGGVEIEIGEEP